MSRLPKKIPRRHAGVRDRDRVARSDHARRVRPLQVCSIQAHAEILETHLVAGGFDYLLKIRVRDMRAYRALIAPGVWSIAGVRETHTYVVMEEVKEAAQLPL